MARLPRQTRRKAKERGFRTKALAHDNIYALALAAIGMRSDEHKFDLESSRFWAKS
jgi:hypothetical protein